jgi:hypothetical protein
MSTSGDINLFLLPFSEHRQLIHVPVASIDCVVMMIVKMLSFKSRRRRDMNKLLVVATAGLLTMSAYAGDMSSASPNASASSSFSALDKNGDGQVSKAEAQADKTVWNSFSTLDANGDGYISQSEYAAAMSGTPATRTPSSNSQKPTSPNSSY